MSDGEEYGLRVPERVLQWFDALPRDEKFRDSHPYAGSNPGRQSVGDPGHCDFCAAFGHVVAHPDYGCGDVGCTENH